MVPDNTKLSISVSIESAKLVKNVLLFKRLSPRLVIKIGLLNKVSP